MTNQHPITPPPELIAKWASSMCGYAEAARWGADHELEACCEWLEDTDCDDPQEVAEHLRTSRRPKPPSLKEQALQALANADGADHPVVATVLTAEQHALIRSALEQLDD